MTAKRVELKFQDHLIDSYSRQGGYARKWASEWQGGVQDLICSIPPIGLHLIEVKHRPTFGLHSCILNPMEPLQREVAKKYLVAGGVVLLCVVGDGVDAVNSTAYFFALKELTVGVFPTTVSPDVAFYSCKYVKGDKYNVTGMAQALWRLKNEHH